ncbi:MAG: outer membrane lipid asymmetry maintenance protein MlaD [Burkholderiales bacterium]|nr:outer membrane lipid asymmetry maintenance protein MlaD [Burkholderiales bacterium]
MKRLSIDFSVGVFVLIGIVCIIFLSLQVANNSISRAGSGNYTLYADFSNIGSLKISAPVKVSGFVIGRVTGITLNNKTYQAVVTMSINLQYKFSSDTSAQILTAGLLGEQYIALQSGADDTYLKDNGIITLTSSALVLENLVGKFMTNMSKE